MVHQIARPASASSRGANLWLAVLDKTRGKPSRVCAHCAVCISHEGLKYQPAASQACRLLRSLCTPVWSIRVVVDVDERDEEGRVGVIIVKSTATVRPRQVDSSRSAGRCTLSGKRCSAAAAMPALATNVNLQPRKTNKKSRTACEAAGWSFQPFVADTYGALRADARGFCGSLHQAPPPQISAA